MTSRTPEQIHNLREVMSLHTGLPRRLLSDEEVNRWGDNLETNLWISDASPHPWEVQVKLRGENEFESWSDISPEKETSVIASFSVMIETVAGILLRHGGNIVAIKITSTAGGTKFSKEFTYERMLALKNLAEDEITMERKRKKNGNKH